MTINGASSKLSVDKCNFTECTAGSSAGAIFVYILDGELNIKDSMFTGCTGIQPGSGGCMYIVMNTNTPKLIINNVKFTNCKLYSYSGDSRYAWGGVIFIRYNFDA